MANEPIITLIGNLTDDPELRYTPSGAQVANFTIAATPRVKKGDDWADGETLFVNCSVWRQYAEHVAETLGRGMRVIAHGRLKARTYETKTGEKRTVFDLDVDEVGPSLRYATARVAKAPRGDGQQGSGWNRQQQNRQNDPWAGGGNDVAPF